jgi:hypothetical protein
MDLERSAFVGRQGTQNVGAGQFERFLVIETHSHN